jgi:phytoene/squalene synthetase
MPNDPADEIERAEEAQAAIHDGIERARELLCEARLALREQEPQKAEPPILAS